MQKRGRFLRLACAATGALVTASTFFGAGKARADDAKEKCANSYDQAQKLKREGKLKEARKELVVCGSEKCPSVLVPYCVQMLKDVDDATPTVLIVAHDEKGQSIDDVRVIVDGEVVAEKLDGRAMPVNPGSHVFRLEHMGSPAWEDKVLVTEGEHGHRIEPTFGAKQGQSSGASTTGPIAPTKPASSASSSASSSSFPVWPVGLSFGIGGAGLILGGVAGGLAFSTKSSLDSACHPKNNCPATSSSDISKLNTLSTVSTVGFVVGGAAVGTGIILAIVASRSSSAKIEKTSSLEIHPWVSPFGAGMSGRF